MTTKTTTTLTASIPPATFKAKAATLATAAVQKQTATKTSTPPATFLEQKSAPTYTAPAAKPASFTAIANTPPAPTYDPKAPKFQGSAAATPPAPPASNAAKDAPASAPPASFSTTKDAMAEAFNAPKDAPPPAQTASVPQVGAGNVVTVADVHATIDQTRTEAHDDFAKGAGYTDAADLSTSLKQDEADAKAYAAQQAKDEAARAATASEQARLDKVRADAPALVGEFVTGLEAAVFNEGMRLDLIRKELARLDNRWAVFRAADAVGEFFANLPGNLNGEKDSATTTPIELPDGKQTLVPEADEDSVKLLVDLYRKAHDAAKDARGSARALLAGTYGGAYTMQEYFDTVRDQFTPRLNALLGIGAAPAAAQSSGGGVLLAAAVVLAKFGGFI